MNIKKLFIFLMSLFFVNSFFAQSNFQISDTYYYENSHGITITLKIKNNNGYNDTLNTNFIYITSDCLPSNTPFNNNSELITFEPYEIKEYTPQVCYNFPNNIEELCYTFFEIFPTLTTQSETVAFYVDDQNSTCIDVNNDGICDYCPEFGDLPPQNDLEIALTVDNFDDIDYLNSFGVEKIEIFNEIGQKINNFDEKTIKIVVFYLKNGEIIRKKYF